MFALYLIVMGALNHSNVSFESVIMSTVSDHILEFNELIELMLRAGNRFNVKISSILC